MAKVIGAKCTQFPNGVRTDRDVLIGPISFASTSAAATQYISVPYACEVVEFQVATEATVVAAPGAWTLSQQSAGADIATVTPTSAAVAGAVATTTAVSNASVAATSTLKILRATSGTVYTAQCSVVVRRATT